MLAKFVDGNISFARGKLLHIGNEIIVNPRDEDFVRAGYKQVEEHRLSEKEGYYQVAEYEDSGDKIIATYHYEEIDEEVDA